MKSATQQWAGKRSPHLHADSSPGLHLDYAWQCPGQSESHSVMSDSFQPHGPYRNSPGQNTWVDSLSHLQGIFPTQGSNPGLLHCGWILYRLSHQGSPRILEWVAYPFSSRSSQPRNWTGVFCIAGRFFTSWATREAQKTQLTHAWTSDPWALRKNTFVLF